MCTSSTFDTESPINRQEATEPKIDDLILPQLQKDDFHKDSSLLLKFSCVCETKVSLAKEKYWNWMIFTPFGVFKYYKLFKWTEMKLKQNTTQILDEIKYLQKKFVLPTNWKGKNKLKWLELTHTNKLKLYY